MNEPRWTLEVEGAQPRAVKDRSEVEKALRKLTPVGKPSFAILDSGLGSYLQVAGGQVSCAVELHMGLRPTKPRQWRAVMETPHRNYSVPVTKHFGAGTLLVQPDEVLWIDDVVAVVDEFLQGQEFPASVRWRELVELDALAEARALGL